MAHPYTCGLHSILSASLQSVTARWTPQGHSRVSGTIVKTSNIGVKKVALEGGGRESQTDGARGRYTSSNTPLVYCWSLQEAPYCVTTFWLQNSRSTNAVAQRPEASRTVWSNDMQSIAGGRIERRRTFANVAATYWSLKKKTIFDL